MADELTPEQTAAIAADFARMQQSTEQTRLALQSQLALISEEAEVFQSIGDQVDANNDLLKIEAQMAQNQIKALELQLQEKIKLGEADEAALKSIGEQIAKQKKLIEGNQDRVKASEALQNTTAGLVTTLTGIDASWKNTFVGSFTESINTATNLSQVIGDVRAGLASTISPSNVLGSSISKVVEMTALMAITQDEATAAFSKTTGTGTQYHGMITEIADANRLYGISAEDSANAVNSLFSQLNLFSGMAPSTQKDLAVMAARMESFGISTDTTAANMELAMRVLGMSAKETGNLQLEVAGYAKQLGLAPQVLAEGFSKTMPTLAAYGKNAVNVFKAIAKQSKETGIAMERLVNWGSKMDTYEGAASIAADFNHLMGGAFLNGLELVNASHEERIDLVQQSMAASGKSFDQMSEHTKRAMAHRLGLESVAEAARLLNPNMIGLTKAQRDARMEEDALAEQAKVAQSMLTQLKNAAIGLAVGIQPLVKGFTGLISKIVEFNDWTRVTYDGWSISLIPALVLGAGAIWGIVTAIKAAALIKGAWVTVTTAATFWQGLMNLALGTGATVASADAAANTADAASKVENAVATTGMTAAQKAANKAGTSGIKTMLALGGAIALMGVGIGAAAAGIGFMAEGFSKLNAEQINAVLIVLGGLAAIILLMGLLMLSPVGVGATVGILALGAAILLMGAGVAIAALGLSVLMASMSSVKPETILAAGAAFTVFAAALLPLMPWILTGPLLAAVLVAIGVAALMIGGGFALAAESIATFDNLLSNISSESVANLAAIADQIERIVDSINDMSTLKAALFENIVAKLVPEGAEIAPTGGAAGVTTAAVQRSQAGVQTAVQTTQKGTKNNAAVQPINIIVKINEKEIGKVAWDKVKEQLNKVGKVTGPLSA